MYANLSLGLMAVGFLLSCIYYGPSVNQSIGLYALLTISVAIALQPFPRVVAVGRSHPRLLLSMAAALALLAGHHALFSVSKDSSFLPSVHLAMLPVMLCATLLLGPRRVFAVFFWLICGFACVASYDFLVHGTRAYFPLADPNNFVTILYLVWVPWLHAQFVDGSGHTNALKLSGQALANFVFAVALLATASRFAQLVLICVVLYWLAGVLSRHVPVRKFLHLVASVGLAVGVFVFTFGDSRVDIDDLEGGLESEVSVGSPRAMLLGSAWNIIQKEGGLVGTGVYTFPIYYPATRSVGEQNTAGLFVHNDFVQLFLEGGIFLTLPLLALVVWVLARWLMSIRTGQLWQLNNGFLLAASLALAHAILNFTIYILPVALVLGMVFANLVQALPQTPSSASISPRWRIGWVLALLLGLLVNVAVGLEAMNYAVFAQQKGLPFADRLREKHQAEFAQVAMLISPNEGLPKYALAKIAQARAAKFPAVVDTDTVERRYREALDVDPWNTAAWYDYGILLQANGKKEEARTVLKRVRALDPITASYTVTSIQFAQKAGDLDAAKDIALSGLRWCELVARRTQDGLNQLGIAAATLNRELASADLSAALDRCRMHRLTRATKRESGGIVNFFKPAKVED